MMPAVPKPNHKRRVAKAGERNKFPAAVREKAKKHYNNTCQECGVQQRELHMHHVKLRSQGARGVFTNCLPVCNDCHKKLHADPKRMEVWQQAFENRFGKAYFMDATDIERAFIIDKTISETDLKEWNKYNSK
jgi:hypothetical protein